MKASAAATPLQERIALLYFNFISDSISTRMKPKCYFIRNVEYLPSQEYLWRSLSFSL